MQATRPPDERRTRHEARGERQPPLWALLAERVRATPERVYMQALDVGGQLGHQPHSMMRGGLKSAP